MNCRQAQHLLSLDRDDRLPADRRAPLDTHLAGCTHCQHHRDQLAAALATLKADTQRIQIPDAQAEWRQLSARIDQTAKPPTRTWRTPDHRWLVIGSTHAALAALALAFILNRPSSAPAPEPALAARAEYVELGDAAATPVVYLDQDSGWLIVWAEGV